MWIKVKTINDQDILVNADKLDTIYPSATKDGQCCNLYFGTRELPLRVKTTFEQLDTLLDVNSIEKCIERLKNREHANRAANAI